MKKNNNLFASLKTEDCHYINYFGSEICLDTPHQLSANKTCIVFSVSKNIGQILINLKFPSKIEDVDFPPKNHYSIIQKIHKNFKLMRIWAIFLENEKTTCFY